jgi:DNA-binding transcriptional LysR family regulator
MRLTLDALETLDAIAEKGSFARAAEVLHRVPSALTYTVNKLESDLGVAIFDRSGKRAVLTAAGRELLDRGRELLRQAGDIEARIKRAGEGWETALTIAVDGVVPLDRIYPMISEFDALTCGTRLRLTREIFGGGWDALIDRRADLALGAPGEAPSGYGLQYREWCRIPFVFACAPGHPLAKAKEPLAADQIARHRVVVVADSSRRLPGRSSGIQPNQDMLVVPTLGAKLEAQIAGLGVGYLPQYLAAPAEKARQLVIRKVRHDRDRPLLTVAWRADEEGQALRWFRERVLGDAALKKFLSAA